MSLFSVRSQRRGWSHARHSLVEQLERRIVLAAVFQNPVDALDVNNDGFIHPIDALIAINDLSRNGIRDLSIQPPTNDAFTDVTGDGIGQPLDPLRVINALNRGVRSPYVLAETGGFVVEQSVVIGLGETSGTRTYRFHVDAQFDQSDTTSALEDTLAIYVVDRETRQTAVDRGELGTSVFTLSGADADFVRPQVRFDGEIVEIDITTSSEDSVGLLVLQLINTDSDTGSVVTVTPLTNSVDDLVTPIQTLRSTASKAAVGSSVDVAVLDPTSDVKPVFSNIRYDVKSDTFTAEMALQNRGTAVGRDVVVVFDELSPTAFVSPISGTDTTGKPYLSFRDAMPPGGLDSGARSAFVDIVLAGSAEEPLLLTSSVRMGEPNRAPNIAALAPVNVFPGEQVRISLGATDPDGDPVWFSVSSADAAPTSILRGDGTLTLAPTPDDIGQYRLTVHASDGLLSSSQSLDVNVAADPVVSTRVSGQVLDVDGTPLSGMEVEIGAVQGLTSADGSFTLNLGAGPLVSDTLKVRGETFPGNAVYPFIAEKLPLVLEHEVFAGVDNVIPRPIFLPQLDVAGGTDVDPAADTTVVQQLGGGETASVFVGAGTLLTQQGIAFDGVLSITEVPRDFTPAALPGNLRPDLVVTIQPGEMVFATPAPLTLPNRSGFAPGTEMDLWSINPVTGDFDNVGRARVSADALSIETISGGVRNSSWHFVAPLAEQPEDPSNDPRREDDRCNECKDRVVATSDVAMHSGALTESHPLASYNSRGAERSLMLVYDSQRADPRPILPVGFDDVDFDPDTRLAARVEIQRGPLRFEVPGAASDVVSGAQGNENFWRIPPEGGSITASVQVDMAQQPTGRYHYRQSTGIVRLNNNSVAGTFTDATADFVHVNSIGSPFGAGWGLAGLAQIIANDDGSLLIVDGDGGESLFEPPPTPGDPHVSPPGDFTVLQQQPGGGFTRTFPNQTVETYNAAGRITEVTDRNGNVTDYQYDGTDRLVRIIDPAGLQTTLSYTGDRLVSIVDPAGRGTLFDYDGSGNLIQITDPDGTSRIFSYDSRHRLISEIDQRGLQETAFYGFHGRVQRVVRGDGTEQLFDPLQTQGLFTPDSTTDPFDPPTAITDPGPIAAASDPNGDVTQRQLDQAGQLVMMTDEIGAGSRTVRDANNLVRTVTDARGNATFFDYDSRGNLVSIIDAEDRPQLISGRIAASGEIDNYEFQLNEGFPLYVDALRDGTMDPSMIHIELQKQFGPQWLFVSGADLDAIDANGIATNGPVTTFLTAGRYRVQVSGIGGHTGDYAFRVQSASGGIPIALGQLVAGVTEQPSGTDLFTLRGQAGEQWFITSQQPLSSQGAFIRVLDPTGAVLSRFAINRDSGPISLPREGSYTVLVEGDLQATDDTRYAFTVHKLDLEAKPAELNQPIVGSLEHPGDVDRFVLSVPSESLVRIDVRLVESLATLRLVGPAGEIVPETNLSVIETSDRALRLEPGEYELVIKSLDGSGRHDLRLQDLFQAQSISLDQRVSGGNINGRVARAYRLNAQAGDQLRIELLERTGANLPSTRVRIFDRYGNQLLNQPLAELNAQFQAAFDGPLFVFLEAPVALSNSANPDFFVFSVTRLGIVPPPPVNGIPLALNQVTSGQVGVGSRVTYEFSLNQRTLLRFDPQTSDPNLRVSLSGDPGTLLNDELFRLDSTDRWFNLPAGDYRVDIRTTGAAANFDFAMLVADQNVPDIGGQLGTQVDISLPSESTQLLRLTLDQPTSLFAELVDFASRGNWSLANDSGQVLASEPLNRDLAVGPLAPGTYFLVLDHFETTTSPIPLSFVLHEQTTELFEIALGGPITGTLEVPGDQDVYRFTLDAQRTLHLACQSPDSAARFSLIGPAGTQFDDARMFDCRYNQPNISQLTFEAPPGEYSVVFEARPMVGTVSYSYDLQLIDLTDAQQPLGGNLTGSLEPSSTDLYAVEFDLPSEVVIRSNSNAPELVVELINADGSDFNPGRFFTSDQSIPLNDPSITVHGSYFIVVHNLADAARDYSYTVDILNTSPAVPSDEPATQVRIPAHLGTHIGYDDTFSLPTRITTSAGRTTDFSLDPQTGDILQVTRLGDAGDDSIATFTYNSAGQVLTSTDGEGRVVAFTYDARGLLESLTEAPGTPIEAVTGFEYDAAGNTTVIHTARGGRIDNQYDDLNRLTRTEGPDPDGVGPLSAPVTEFVYDDVGNLLLIRDPLGRESEFSYDARNRLRESRNALQQSTFFAYDAAGNNTRVVDARGNATDQEFDARGRLAAIVDALGNRTTFSYDLDDNLVETMSPLDEVIRLEYDSRNRVTSLIDPLDNHSRTLYDADDLVVALFDANQNQQSFEYDALGRLITSIDALGNSSALQYDATDRIVASTNALGQTAEFEYDARGRLVRLQDAIGGQSQFAYDLESNRVSSTDELGNLTVFDYDLLGRLILRTDADPDGVGPLQSPMTSFTYDAAGNQLTRTDALQNTTTFEYDELDRVVEETDPRGGVRDFSYDAAGNLTNRTDRNGRATTFVYDPLNRLVTENWLDDNSQPIRTFDITYDAVGRLLSASDDGSSVMSTYDAAGRVTTVTQSVQDAPAVTLDSTYDAVGNRTQVLESINGLAAAQTRYFYDELNRLARIEQSAQSGAVDVVADKRVDLFYNALGQFDRITRYADLAGQSEVVDSLYAYDGLSRLATLEHRDATDAVLANYAYDYDAASRIVEIANIDGVADYTYDALSRLLAVDHADPARDESYIYDAAGNRTSSHLHDADYVTETGNRVTADGQFAYGYDAEGNLILRTDVASGEVRELKYDHRNRLVRVTDRASDNGIITAETTYRYDAFNRRVAKSHDADGQGPQATSAEYYVHDGDQILLEFTDADGPAGAAAPVLAARNLYGPGVDFLLAVEQPQQNRILWTLADHQNTIRDIVDSDGIQHNHLIYDAYGNLLSQTLPALAARFLYTGRELDAESGLYYYRARYYDPALGRFISEDPIGFEGGDNLFAYVADNPVNNTDAFGRQAATSAAMMKNDLAQIFANLAEVAFQLQTAFGKDSPVHRQFDATAKFIATSTLVPLMRTVIQNESKIKIIELNLESLRQKESAQSGAFRKDQMRAQKSSPDSATKLTQVRRALFQARAEIRRTIGSVTAPLGRDDPAVSGIRQSFESQIRQLEDLERSYIEALEPISRFQSRTLPAREFSLEEFDRVRNSYENVGAFSAFTLASFFFGPAICDPQFGPPSAVTVLERDEGFDSAVDVSKSGLPLA